MEGSRPCKHPTLHLPRRVPRGAPSFDPMAVSLVQASFLEGFPAWALLLSSLCPTQQPARPLTPQLNNFPISLVQPTPLRPAEDSPPSLTLPSPFFTPVPVTILHPCPHHPLARNAFISTISLSHPLPSVLQGPTQILWDTFQSPHPTPRVRDPPSASHGSSVVSVL